jgi:hypothetical protein
VLSEAQPLAEKPKLPDPPAGETWHPLAVEWWKDLWALPQAEHYSTMHKHRAYLALFAMHLFYSDPTERKGQRLEVALQGLGLGESDLRRLQWTAPVAAAPTAEKAIVSDKPVRRRDPRKHLRIVNE